MVVAVVDQSGLHHLPVTRVDSGAVVSTNVRTLQGVRLADDRTSHPAISSFSNMLDHFCTRVYHLHRRVIITRRPSFQQNQVQLHAVESLLSTIVHIKTNSSAFSPVINKICVICAAWCTISFKESFCIARLLCNYLASDIRIRCYFLEGDNDQWEIRIL